MYSVSSYNGAIADVLTKGLPKWQFAKFIDKLTMEDIFKPAWGGVLVYVFDIFFNYIYIFTSSD